MRGDDAAAVLVILVILGSAVGIIIWSLTLRYRRRELQHRERMAALEKGAPLPALTDVETRAPWTPRTYLLRGMMWLFSGMGVTAFLLALVATSDHPQSVEDRIWAAQRLKERGATEDQIRQVENDKTPQRHGGPPIGIAFIGLVPIGVGLAYLITYRAERNTAQ